MPGSKRTPSPQGLVSFPPRHLAHSDVFAVQGPFPNGRFSFGLTPLQLSPELSRFAFKAMLSRQNLLPVWDFALEHGRLNLSLPFNAPPVSESNLRAGGGTGSKVIFEIPTLTDSILQNSRSLENFASAIGAEPSSLRGRHLWIVYENDGAPPFNPGSGSDQGPTAFLGIYFSFDDKSKGLTKVGWTVIDMRTPKGTLPSGAPFSSSSRYETPRGPYSGISSIDFTVTVHRTGQVKIDILGAVGVDSSKWGKFVQDAIHEKISNSPLFPWPKDSLKPFAEGGVAVLLTPQKILSDGEVLGISYEGRIEFGGKLSAGTHSVEGMADARYVIRTGKVKTPMGDFTAEYSPLGAFGRAFVRYNDGREAGFTGVEGGMRSNVLVKIGRLGIGLAGEITVSTDPALQTDNPVGSQPFLSPLNGGPAGHHGKGQLILKWEF